MEINELLILKKFKIYCNFWDVTLGHPGLTMMRRIIESSNGHPLKDQKFPQSGNTRPCKSCSIGKLIIKPSQMKVEKESPRFLERIQGDICGPIHPHYKKKGH